MRYAIIDNGIVTNVAESAHPMADNWILSDEAGAGWLYDGTTFTPPPPAPVPVPHGITPRQCRLQLLTEGLLDEVEAAIDTMPQAAKIEWEYALEIKRSYGFVIAMQALLGKDDSEMDTFFTEAAKL